MQLTKRDLNKTVRAHPDRISWNRSRWIVDAKGKTLWRLAVEIAKKLIWKHKAYYADHHDCGDYVVVLNAGQIVTTWNKTNNKIYYKHTGYKGHLRETTLGKMLSSKPLNVMEYAVRWMLPKNKLRKLRLKRLKLFIGTEHPYTEKSLINL